jgi:uncharacterized membrane protein YagU involved in acid resistance
MMREALRGVAATAVMSVPMALRWAAQPRVQPPPMVIAEGLQRKLGLEPAARGPIARHATWLAAHFGFGASIGALSRLWPRPAGALPYGIAVWFGNYGLLMPAVRLYPPLTRDSRVRAAETVAAHVVYAATLRALNGSGAPRRRAHVLR